MELRIILNILYLDRYWREFKLIVNFFLCNELLLTKSDSGDVCLLGWGVFTLYFSAIICNVFWKWIPLQLFQSFLHITMSWYSLMGYRLNSWGRDGIFLFGMVSQLASGSTWLLVWKRFPLWIKQIRCEAGISHLSIAKARMLHALSVPLWLDV
jgi:hypothetical protein